MKQIQIDKKVELIYLHDWNNLSNTNLFGFG